MNIGSRRVNARVVLAGIVLLAAVARFMAIGSRLHVDDAYTWLVASQPNAHAFLRQLAATENTPLLSYLLLTPLPINDPVWLRLPAALCGILMCVAVYVALRRPLGTRTALLAALGVAVSPFLITDSDLARGFMLEDLALLVALWAVLALSERETRGRWSAFVLAGVVALYTEYSAGIFLIALTVSALWLGRPARRRMALAAVLPFVALIPWIPQIVHAENQVGITKLHPMFAAPSLRGLRDSVVILAFGENGGTTSSAGRWLELAAIVALAVAAAIVIRRGPLVADSRGRQAIALIAATVTLTLLGHALAPVVGVDVFTQRYMTILAPLAAALGAAAVVSVGRESAIAAACVLLVAVGLLEVVRRYRGEYEPDMTPVRQAAIAAHPRTVLTNTPIVLFYLRSLHPVFDRPSNLGPGRAASCGRPCLIIDDSRANGGTPRQATGTRTMIGPYLLTLER
jgi:4-amino-4-deoxy-L-arabinose transferase-like glycosyltransferase